MSARWQDAYAGRVRAGLIPRLPGNLSAMNPNDHDIFQLAGTTRQQAIVRTAIDRCSFPWGWLRAGLHADTGREKIPVDWQDLTRYRQASIQAGAQAARGHGDAHDITDPLTNEKAHVLARERVLGLAWYSGKVTLDVSLERDPELAGEVFLSEGAHMIDFFWMADKHRVAVWNALHPEHQQLDPDRPVADGEDLGHGHSWFDVGGYASWVGEAFMGAFVAAFSDYKVTMLFPDHPVTPRAAQAIKAALIPSQPAPDPFVGAKRSSVYHHPRCWIVPAILAPIDLGVVPPEDRRPCRLCKPDQPHGLRRGPGDGL